MVNGTEGPLKPGELERALAHSIPAATERRGVRFIAGVAAARDDFQNYRASAAQAGVRLPEIVRDGSPILVVYCTWNARRPAV